MKIFIFLLLFCLTILSYCTLNAQVVAPDIEWQKCFGGSDNDEAFSVQQTLDGGFIVAGVTSSEDGDVTGNHGKSDYWILKLDAGGNLSWQKCLGGTLNESAQSIQQTDDGGFIVTGHSDSHNGDVSLNHGKWDYWTVKLNIDGNILWEKPYGGDAEDDANSIKQTTDGGFIIAGTTHSNDGNVSGNHLTSYGFPSHDYWIVKLDTAAGIVWKKCFGGSYTERAYSVDQTSDGGYIVAGSAESEDGQVSGKHGGADYWILKLDSAKDVEWKECFGGSESENPHSIQQTADGGFIVAGYTGTPGNGDVSYNHGTNDYWIVKLNFDGSIQWEKSFGGSSYDYAWSVQQTKDYGFIVSGSGGSDDGDVLGNHGSADCWIIKLDTAGNLLWQKTLGGTMGEVAYAIQETTDGGYIIAGVTDSNDGDVTGNHLYYDDYYQDSLTTNDFWIVKLKGDLPTTISGLQTNFISVSPNPVQHILTLNLDSGPGEVSLRVYDGQQKILSVPVTIGETKARLDTSGLPDGFYTLQIINTKTGKSTIAKFVKTE